MPRRLALTSLCAALALLALPIAGASARSVPTGFFGANWDRDIRYKASPTVQLQAWDRMAQVGVESQRTNFNWAAAQFYGPDQKFDWKHTTDPIVKLAAAHHIRLLPVVMTAPEWARSRHKRNAPPSKRKAYAKYLVAAIKRYGPHGSFWKRHPELPKVGIRDWQIWNEPSEQYQWDIPSDRDWAPGYAKLLKIAYKAAKKADPSVRIVLAGLPSRSWEYLAHLYDVGHIHGYFDIAAVHPFSAEKHGPLIIAKYFRKVMRENKDGKKPLLVTETTLPASKGKAESQYGLETTDAGMARFLTATYTDFMKNRKKLRIGRVYWETWASGYEGMLFDYTGLVRYRNDNGEESTKEMPALGAFEKLALRAEGCSKDVTGECTGSPP